MEIWKTYGSHGLKVRWCLVLEVIRVCNLLRLPNTFVRRVIDVLRAPFALICRVLLHWGLPFSAARGFLTFGVRYARCDPVTVFLIIPILWLLGLWVRNPGWFVIKPVLRFCGFLIDDLVGSILIPVFWLSSLRIWNTSFINPVLRFGVFGIINLLLRINRRGEVLKETASLHLLAVDLDSEGLVRFHDKSVKRGGLQDTCHGSAFEVLLLIFAGLRILVLENEMNLSQL